MYNNKKCIAIVFDQSFIIYNVLIPIGIIKTIMEKNKDSYFVYGGLPRLTDQVEQFGLSLKIPKDRLIKIEIPQCIHKKILVKELSAKWLLSMLSYKPDKLFIFRDSSHINETVPLITNCMKLKIPVIEYNNRGEFREVHKNPSEINPFFMTTDGWQYPY